MFAVGRIEVVGQEQKQRKRNTAKVQREWGGKKEKNLRGFRGMGTCGIPRFPLPSSEDLKTRLLEVAQSEVVATVRTRERQRLKGRSRGVFDSGSPIA